MVGGLGVWLFMLRRPFQSNAVNSINTGTITPGKIHRDYKRIEWASREKSRDKLNTSNGGSGM